MINTEWIPTPRQEIALEQSAYEIGYGGARGGGKTEAGIAWLLYDKDNPRYRALVIRKQADDLKDWVDRAERFYTPFGGKKVGFPGDFTFPSGAIIRTGHLKTENAYSKYVGHEYHKMLIEELNLIPAEENYLKLISSCRSTIPELKPQIFSTFNPSDTGFFWIKKRFRLHGIPEDPIYTKDEKTGLMRVFIPAKLKDNPFLMIDQQYKSFLDGLPDGLREAWRDGSWDEPIIKGAFYTYEITQAKRENRITFLPYDPRLKVHTIWDLGIDDSMTIGFVQRTARETKIINYYENNGFGIDHYIAKLQELQRENRYIYGSHFAPHDANKRELSTGQTVVDTAKKLGLKFEVVPRVDITSGIMKVRLMFPRLFFNEEKCGQLLDALRNYRKEWDDELLKFSDKPIHDWSSHGADCIRYLAMIEEKLTNEEDNEVWDFKEQIKSVDPYQ